jgi:hypothetical protein
MDDRLAELGVGGRGELRPGKGHHPLLHRRCVECGWRGWSELVGTPATSGREQTECDHPARLKGYFVKAPQTSALSASHLAAASS